MRPWVIALGIVACMLPAAAVDWPGFRGPNGSGVVETSGLPVAFGPTRNLVWKTPVPFANSSPIVAANRIFLSASQGELLITLSLDAASGKVLWRREVTRLYRHEIYKANDPASPTPATDGRNVYVFFPDFGLVAYDVNGGEQWQIRLGPFKNFYGMAASPVVIGDAVVLLCDQNADSFLLAVDAASGKIRWKTPRPEAGSGWATPAAYQPAGAEPQVLAVSMNSVDAYSLKSGRKEWWLRRFGGSPFGVPLLQGTDLFFTSMGSDRPEFPSFAASIAQSDANHNGFIERNEMPKDVQEHFGWFDTDGNGSIDEKEYETARMEGVGEYGTVRVRLGGSGALPQDRVAWRFKKNIPTVPAPLLYRNVIYMVKDGGIITSLAAADGRMLKQGRSPKAVAPYFASPVAADGKVFLVAENGKVTVLEAGAEWRVLAVNDMNEECYATPAIADGRIYIRTRSALYAFGSGGPQ